MVQYGPFQRSILNSYAFASVGLQEEVGGTTTAGDWVWCGFGDGWAIFFVVAGNTDLGRATINL